MNKYSCVYNTLSNYNSSETAEKMRSSGIHPPVPVGTPSMATQLIPVYNMIGYEALTHDGRCTCGGHFNIVNAYPDYNKNCTKFVKRSCS